MTGNSVKEKMLSLYSESKPVKNKKIMEIANPIYDVVFKYMMEDNTVAKLLVSSIIGEEVVSL